MRRITVSVLSALVCTGAFADARLPVVNIASGGVSARAAFGVATPTQAQTQTIAAQPVAQPAPAAPQKQVVARATQKPKQTAAKTQSVDKGATLAADVLTPRKPTSDIWAHGTGGDIAPLRLPRADEFAVLRDDSPLPEENIITKPAVAMAAPVQPAQKQGATSELDAQIARLVELQRRADASAELAKTQSVAAVQPQIAAAQPAPIRIENRTAPVADTKVAASNKKDTASDVKISRMVVPMTTPDVVVRAVEKNTSPKIAAVRDDMSSMSPSELRKAFRKTFLSENKHLSTFQMDNRFDVASDMTSSVEGFTSARDLSEGAGIRTLEIKIRFRDADSALSRENYNLLTEYAALVVSNPKRAIQVAIPQRATKNMDERKLAARRLAIVEQVLRDNGVSEQRVVPVLSQREDEGFVLRVISNDQFETLTKQQKDIFGDTVSKKSYKSMAW